MFKKKNNIQLEDDGQLKLKPSRKERKEEKKRIRAEKKALREEIRNVEKSVVDLIPLLDVEYDEYFRTTYGYMNIFQIASKDVYSLNQDEIGRHLHDFANFLKLYQDDMKIVCMQFPVNTEEQQENILKKIKKAEIPMYHHFLQKRLDELQFLEKNRYNKEYFLFIYAKNLNAIREREELIFRISNENMRFKKIDLDKKLKILFKLANQNSKI